MKTKKITAIGLVLLPLLISSCGEDFLNQTDPTKVNVDLFYKNEAQAKQALNGVYGQVQTITTLGYLFGEFQTDNTTIDLNPSDRGGAGGWEAFEFSTVNSGNGEINAVWNIYYATLYNANLTLEKLPDAEIADGPKKEIEGQLKFLRAYLYFNLVQYFGDVVIVTSTFTVPEPTFDLVRSPQTEVWAQIEKDLKEAIALLPAKYAAAGDKGRATKGAALSLLGKTYLTTKKYADAVTTLKEVTTLGYALNTNYADNFDPAPAKKNGPESIFEIQYQGDNDLGEQSSFQYVFAPRVSKGAVTGFAAGGNGGRNSPTNDMIAAYETGDLRKDLSLKTSFTLDGKVYPVPHVTKYNYPHTIIGRTNTNWPVLRYSDVLLMLAEAINEQSGPTAEAADYLNQVRKRAGLAATKATGKAVFRTAVLKERRVELAFENHRWFDLKRTKTPAEWAAFMNAHGAAERAKPTIDRGNVPFNSTDYVFTENEYLLPIPAPQILINAKLTQNPGY
ncbi:RagB/SusD family nutrient uptake outer membrane protein [Dyadobacter chenwenxiniae]|uniref:RagB/SusD family nutrient uptake outer membrane protein n=1 Tax=Dyadobacter chenwenxiniae TaxID=2906456 RepID=A0A9X1PP11_9BACT|nr:RagB/SusD family nutrient uptake outer membrane protein [Dyadobacter chenwenxiniae]MCF0063063.1 RagB/SusD family nutrient uptake outer membrane protein [Dyadobacter chenwenxiniae]UON84764.1 RagB/SusD family nutrient uptake outer membrane protein [Dyadobacter chenwenxiniae]